MSCETFKTTIGGIEYKYTQLPASKSINLKLRIAKVFSQSVGLLRSGLGTSEDNQFTLISQAINQTLKESSPEEVTNLLFDCVKTVQIGDDQIDPDKQFSGELLNLYALVFWVIKKEYESFFLAATGLYVKVPVAQTTGRRDTSPT